MPFASDANALIERRNFEELEALWMAQIESDPSDVDAFLRVGKALRKAEQRPQRFLTDGDEGGYGAK